MLTEEQNRLLTQVGPGTRMGNLLRRYWMPIAAVSEFESNRVKAVRLMGEDLVLYKDLSGHFGLVERHCPHRRADLSYGFVEECGLRCNYHGWLWSEDGRCLEQPFEDVAHPEAGFRDKVRIAAYPVEAKGGMLWAYLGPQPAPLLPNFAPFTWKNGFVQIVFSKVPCNWLQGQENSIDPVHFEWMHHNWILQLRGSGGARHLPHTRIDFREFEWGFMVHRQLQGWTDDNPRWLAGRCVLWPNAFGPIRPQFIEYRVPIDDQNTLSVVWYFSRVPREREPYVQESIPSWEGPISDPFTGKLITSHVLNQDFVAWIGQGTISDRTQEHLGASDRGVILLRKRLLDDIERIERGEDPKAIVRDPKLNAAGIQLPVDFPDLIRDGLPLEKMMEEAFIDPRLGFTNQIGQPESVRRAFLDAMGMGDGDQEVRETNVLERMLRDRSKVAKP
jgi:5,5'-dehydrodivanillate O-demethylase oxygenase subunit